MSHFANILTLMGLFELHTLKISNKFWKQNTPSVSNFDMSFCGVVVNLAGVSEYYIIEMLFSNVPWHFSSIGCVLWFSTL